MTAEHGKPPGDFIRLELDRRGWGQDDLARIMGRPPSRVSELIRGKLGISLDIATELAAAFGGSAEEWLQREAIYQLSRAGLSASAVERRAKLFELAPVKEMERRQWIQPTDSVEDLEAELRRFFGVESLEEVSRASAVTRKSDTDEPLSPSQRAWCFRVRQMANTMLVAEYREDKLQKHPQVLRKIAAHPQEAHKVANALAACGIRFVVVEPLQGAKVDGVAMWLDDSSPVIGVSLRYDRIDSFWHTVCHEWSHISHRDEAPLDSDLTVTESVAHATVLKSAMERRADEEAAAMLIPNEELTSFIRRVGPLYSKDRIGRFANRIKMHPGIIVGQLQHRGEIGYYANREMLVKIRQAVVSAAVTDGWGRSIDPRSTQQP